MGVLTTEIKLIAILDTPLMKPTLLFMRVEDTVGLVTKNEAKSIMTERG